MREKVCVCGVGELCRGVVGQGKGGVIQVSSLLHTNTDALLLFKQGKK